LRIFIIVFHLKISNFRRALQDEESTADTTTPIPYVKLEIQTTPQEESSPSVFDDIHLHVDFFILGTIFLTYVTVLFFLNKRKSFRLPSKQSDDEEENSLRGDAKKTGYPINSRAGAYQSQRESWNPVDPIPEVQKDYDAGIEMVSFNERLKPHDFLSNSELSDVWSFKRGDQVQWKGKQCTITSIDHSVEPSVCTVRLKTGDTFKTELRLLQKVKSVNTHTPKKSSGDFDLPCYFTVAVKELVGEASMALSEEMFRLYQNEIVKATKYDEETGRLRVKKGFMRGWVNLTDIYGEPNLIPDLEINI